MGSVFKEYVRSIAKETERVSINVNKIVSLICFNLLNCYQMQIKDGIVSNREAGTLHACTAVTARQRKNTITFQLHYKSLIDIN